MIVAVVKFPIPKTMSRAEFHSQMAASVPIFRRTPGLRRKHYLYDPDRHAGGGIYFFESRADADACFTDGFVYRLTIAFGRPEIRYFESILLIDNETHTVEELKTA